MYRWLGKVEERLEFFSSARRRELEPTVRSTPAGVEGCGMAKRGETISFDRENMQCWHQSWMVLETTDNKIKSVWEDWQLFCCFQEVELALETSFKSYESTHSFMLPLMLRIGTSFYMRFLVWEKKSQLSPFNLVKGPSLFSTLIAAFNEWISFIRCLSSPFTQGLWWLEGGWVKEQLLSMCCYAVLGVGD